MRFRRTVVSAVAAGLLFGVARVASADAQKPLGKMTCEDFVAVDETIKPKLVYFAVAYAKGGKPEAAVLDIDATDKITPMLIQECQAQPKASFWAKVKAEVKKIGKKL